MSNLNNFVRLKQGVFFIEKKSRKVYRFIEFKVIVRSTNQPANPLPKRLIQPSHIHRHNLLKTIRNNLIHA